MCHVFSSICMAYTIETLRLSLWLCYALMLLLPDKMKAKTKRQRWKQTNNRNAIARSLSSFSCSSVSVRCANISECIAWTYIPPVGGIRLLRAHSIWKVSESVRSLGSCFFTLSNVIKALDIDTSFVLFPFVFLFDRCYCHAFLFDKRIICRKRFDGCNLENRLYVSNHYIQFIGDGVPFVSRWSRLLERRCGTLFDAENWPMQRRREKVSN